MTEHIHITVPGSAEDPRVRRAAVPAVVVHYVPELHPDDVAVVNGLPLLGILDMAAVRAARGRVEWRPSLAMLDEVVAEFS
ncbi:MAG: hypothetical protein ACJ76X_00400 [Solirubrobacteraceae bacterium]|jgi:hypothetical protein